MEPVGSAESLELGLRVHLPTVFIFDSRVGAVSVTDIHSSGMDDDFVSEVMP